MITAARFDLKMDAEEKAIVAKAAAVFVFTATKASKLPSPTDIVLPGLNPNQPNHSKPVPRSTKGMLAGEIATLISELFLK